MFRLVYWLCVALVLALFFLGKSEAPSARTKMDDPKAAVPSQPAATTPAPPVQQASRAAASPTSPLPLVQVQAVQEQVQEGIKKTLVTFQPAQAPMQVVVSKRDAPAGYVSPQLTQSNLVKVTGTRVNLRRGPSTGTAVVAALSKGTVATVLSRTASGWIELQMADGTQGFMSARFLVAAN